MKVVIEVTRGCAEVTKKPSGVTLVIIDHDCDVREIYPKKEVIPKVGRNERKKILDIPESKKQ